MNIETVLALIGFLATLALSVNAFFLRGIHKDLGDVRVQLQRLITLDETKEKDIEELKDNQKEIFKRIGDLEKSKCACGVHS